MKRQVNRLLEKAKAGSFPKNLEPMLATLVNEPVEEPGWIYEIKWDGYRAISYLNKGKVNILSQNNKSFDEKFYPIHQALKKWKIDAVVDGEIVVVNEQGMPDFGDLQLWRSEADGQLAYFIFDILWLEGKNLMDLPLAKRAEILKAVVPEEHETIRRSEQFNTPGKDFFLMADRMGLEGIFAKKLDSIYTPGKRSKHWLKIKTEKRQEF